MTETGLGQSDSKWVNGLPETIMRRANRTLVTKSFDRFTLSHFYFLHVSIQRHGCEFAGKPVRVPFVRKFRLLVQRGTPFNLDSPSIHPPSSLIKTSRTNRRKTVKTIYIEAVCKNHEEKETVLFFSLDERWIRGRGKTNVPN